MVKILLNFLVFFVFKGGGAHYTYTKATYILIDASKSITQEDFNIYKERVIKLIEEAQEGEYIYVGAIGNSKGMKIFESITPLEKGL
jgi:hypothetical protein